MTKAKTIIEWAVLGAVTAIGVWAIRNAPKAGHAIDEAIAPLTNTSYRAQVIRVSDGDTITLEDGTRIRFCGIDAPESDQPGGEESTEFLNSLLDFDDGNVIIDPVERDRYGRTIAEVWAKTKEEDIVESLINVNMIKHGHAWHYRQYVGNCPNRPAYETAEELARSAGIYPELLGAIAPWEWRRK